MRKLYGPLCAAVFCYRFGCIAVIAIVLSGCKPAATTVWATPAPTKAQLNWLQRAYDLPGAPDFTTLTRCNNGKGFRRTEVEFMMPYSLIEELAVDPQGKWRLQRWEETYDPNRNSSREILRHTTSDVIPSHSVATFEHGMDKAGFNRLSPSFDSTVRIWDAGSWMMEACSKRGYRFMIRQHGAAQAGETKLPLLFDDLARAANFDRMSMKKSP